MKFNVSAGALARELALAMGAVEKRTTIPILGNVKLTAEGGEVRIEATDLEISFCGRVDATVSEAGAITLPARKLADYVSRLHGEAQLSFSLGANLRGSMTCEKSKVQIAGMAVEAWPSLPYPVREIATVPAKALVGASRRVAFAISDQQSRYALPGALLELRDGSMTATATDGSRLSLASYDIEFGGDWKSLIPRRAMAELVRSPGDGEVAIGEDDNHLFFGFGERRIIARKMTGNFPNVARTMPKSFKHRVTFSGSEMISAIGRVLGWSDDEKSRRVILSLSDRIVVSASNTDGSGEEEVGGSCDCEPTAIYVSATYLTDAVKACGGMTAIEFNNKHDAIRITPAESRDGEKLIGIVMPMRA